MIIQNEARCRECGERIHSKHVHDFVRCKCGNIAVDGGLEYLRRVGKGIMGGMEELSVSLPYTAVKAAKAEIKAVQERPGGANELGLLCAVVRILRDYQLLSGSCMDGTYDRDRGLHDAKKELSKESSSVEQEEAVPTDKK